MGLVGQGTGHRAKHREITACPKLLGRMAGCGGAPVVLDGGCVVASKSKWLPAARTSDMRSV